MTENEKNYKKALEDIISLGNNSSSLKKKSTVKSNKNTLSKAIAIAKECLEKSNKIEEKFKAPFGCIVDDEGTILSGTWNRKNGGHGDTWWRFDAEECSNDDD